MSVRRLTPDERAAWGQLARSVRSIHVGPAFEAPDLPVAKAPSAKVSLTPPPLTPALVSPARRPARVLDDSWERQIKRGLLTPELAIDLHGHTLAAAHARLDQALAQARSQGVRVVLIVTGKPRNRAAHSDAGQRGAIRAEIGHWLEAGHHADAIASVRSAHPRHGGDGAIYVILRRKK